MYEWPEYHLIYGKLINLFDTGVVIPLSIRETLPKPSDPTIYHERLYIPYVTVTKGPPAGRFATIFIMFGLSGKILSFHDC
jgi:hypothetical protein